MRRITTILLFMKLTRRCIVLSSLLPLLMICSMVLPASSESTKSLIDLPEKPVTSETETWLKQHGWKPRRLRDDPGRWEVGNRLLHMVSEGDSTEIITKPRPPINPNTWPRLRFRLRVVKNPVGTNLAKRDADDAAFRIYVAFKRGGMWPVRPPHTLVYIWTENVEPETFIPTEKSKNLYYLSIGMGVTAAITSAGTAGWKTIERDLLDDYREAFPDETDVPNLVAIVLKCDSNNTDTSADAWLSTLELVNPTP